MESNRFDMIARHLGDVGTRRKAIMSLATAGLGLTTMQLLGADAKKRKHKKRKKRCKNLGEICTPGGKRKCCSTLLCETRPGNTAPDCCIPLGSVCETAEDCCVGTCIPPLIGSGSKTCRILT